MDIFLLPVPRGGAALYCERPLSAATPDSGTGLRARLVHKLDTWLAEAESSASSAADTHRDGVVVRVRRRIQGWLVQAIAEQRVLWMLRGESAARLVHPDDTPSFEAEATMRTILRQDRRRHLRWLAVDAVLGLVSIPVALVPGPNVLGYYFLFRTVGHYLSIAGAGHGLSRVHWSTAPSADLTAIRAAFDLETGARHDRLAAIGTSLGLVRLAAFLEACVRRA